MNKGELVRSVADRTKMTLKESNVLLDAVLEVITEAVSKGEKV